MKTLNTYINEWKLTDDSKTKVSFYNFFPETKEELSSLIHKRLEDNPTKPDLLDISTVKLNDLSGIFAGTGSKYCLNGYGIGSIEELDLHTWDVSNVESFECMFHKCYSLKKLNLSGWNTHKARNINGMFEECESLESLDLSNFDTRNIRIMTWVFCRCKKLKKLNLSGWKTSKVTTIEEMFYNCIRLEEIKGIENWDISNIMNKANAFLYCNISPSWYKN